MKRVLGLASMLFVAACAALPAQGPPPWAYGTPGPAPATPPAAAPAPAAPAPQAPPDTTLRKLAGSNKEFTRAEISNGFGPADWYPEDHPQMPPVVAQGKRPEARACSLCHYPNGKGRPENAGVAGLPVEYFIQTMNDFRNGLRKSAEPRKNNTNGMIAIAKALTEDEIRQAAEYFGAMKWTPWIRVVEAEQVPKTRIAGGMFIPLEGSEKEPLGKRIIEMPEKPENTEILRDPRSGFVAYVPVGSIKKGEALANTGQCGLCHGPDLKGLGPVPGIAGRSPSYLVRQMYDMQQKARNGTWTQLMMPVVSRLSEEDLLNVAAYVSSRTP